jgi:hypothetical protein
LGGDVEHKKLTTTWRVVDPVLTDITSAISNHRQLSRRKVKKECNGSRVDFNLVVLAHTQKAVQYRFIQPSGAKWKCVVAADSSAGRKCCAAQSNRFNATWVSGSGRPGQEWRGAKEPLLGNHQSRLRPKLYPFGLTIHIHGYQPTFQQYTLPIEAEYIPCMQHSGVQCLYEPSWALKKQLGS